MKKLLTGGSFFCRLRKIQILLFILILTGAVQSALFAQNGGGSDLSAGVAGVRFRQRLEWSADKNAFEYKVEIRSGGKTVKTFTTADNFVNLNLPAGNYDYRVTVYDFLGREQDVSAWQKFEISKANEPAFSNVQSDVKVDLAADGKIVLPVEVDNVAAGASVVLVNVKTGEKIKGALVLSGAVTGASEIKKASAEFPKISAGEWKLVVENPSGLSSESPAISVKTYDSVALAKEKAEEEKRLAREEEKAAKEAAELAAKEEMERLAREEAERKAEEKAAKQAAELAEKEAKKKEKLAAKELQTNRMYVMADDDEAEDEAELAEREAREAAEREEAERLAAEKAEKERLAAEEAERKKAEKLARAEEREKKKAARAARKSLGIEIKAGAAVALNLFESDLLQVKNYDTLTQGAMPENITLAPLASISYVPNLNWIFRPGLEITAGGFVYENRSAPFGNDEWEYNQKFCYNKVQASLIGQLSIWPQKIFLNVKAGGGLTEILTSTEYIRDREAVTKAFTYPTLNAGLSFEFVLFKNLVFELGADYNRILSSKVNFSYLMPYLEVGVRF